jgi:hypothetical protein
MIDLTARKANRLRVMNLIFEEADGREHVYLGTEAIAARLGLSDEEMASACDFLAGEHFIQPRAAVWGKPYPLHVSLTYRGIEEIEQSREEPEEGTEHFPPLVSVIQIYGDVTNSNVQAGTVDSSQWRTTSE